jgi:hypothetical protein
VIVDGTLRQVAPPMELLAAPADRFVVALTGGSVVGELAVYPWDVEVRPGRGPQDALHGVVAGTTLDAGRVRVRVGDWVGETVHDLAAGDVVHGIVHRSHALGS